MISAVFLATSFGRRARRPSCFAPSDIRQRKKIRFKSTAAKEVGWGECGNWRRNGGSGGDEVTCHVSTSQREVDGSRMTSISQYHPSFSLTVFLLDCFSLDHIFCLSLFVSMCFFFRFPTNTNLYFPLPFRQHFDSVNRTRDTLPSDPHRSLRPWTWGIRALVRGERGPCSKAQRDTLVIDLTLRSMPDSNIISYFSEGLSLVERARAGTNFGSGYDFGAETGKSFFQHNFVYGCISY